MRPFEHEIKQRCGSETWYPFDPLSAKKQHSKVVVTSSEKWNAAKIRIFDPNSTLPSSNGLISPEGLKSHRQFFGMLDPLPEAVHRPDLHCLGVLFEGVSRHAVLY